MSSRSPTARPSVGAPLALLRGRPGTEGSTSLSAPAVLVVAVAVVVVVVSAVAWAMANYIHVPHGSPEVPKLDVTVQDQEEQRCREGALSLLQHLRPHWDPQEVTLQVTPSSPPGVSPNLDSAGGGAGALSPFSSRMMGQTRREPLGKGPCASSVRPAKVTPPSFTIAD